MRFQNLLKLLALKIILLKHARISFTMKISYNIFFQYLQFQLSFL